jgi:hypothetical protein
MKNRSMIMIAAVVLAAGYFIGQMTTTRADGVNQIATAEDPLVTKSYVDQVLKGHVPTNPNSSASTGASGSVGPSLDEIEKLVSSEVEKRFKQQAPNSSPSSTATSSITIVNLSNSQTLFAGEGAEFIVRTGKVNIVSTDGNGVPDVTAGKDLQPNAPVELNHLLVFPREGRGIKPDAKNVGDIYVMIRGNYLIVENDKK